MAWPTHSIPCLPTLHGHDGHVSSLDSPSSAPSGAFTVYTANLFFLAVCFPFPPTLRTCKMTHVRLCWAGRVGGFANLVTATVVLDVDREGEHLEFA